MRRTRLIRLMIAVVMLPLSLPAAAAAGPPADQAPSWSRTAPMQRPRAMFDMTVLLDERVLAAGGTAGAGALAAAELFTAHTGTWTAAAPLHQARNRHVLVTLNDGRALAVGGRAGGMSLASAELYLPSLNQWRSTSPLALARDNHAATLLTDGRVLVTGGVSASAPGQPEVTNTAEIYDPDTETWRPAASMRQARYNHSASLLPDGRIMVIGGFVPGPFHVATRSAEVYDPAVDRWQSIAPMPTARAVHATAALASGAVLVAGGVTNPPNELNATDASEIYHPATDSWPATGALTVSRRSLSGAAVLVDGAVLAPGGADDTNQRLASAELFDPAARAWSSTASMHTARVGFALEQLTGHQVLVAGGIGDAGEALTSAEVYER